MKKVKVKDLTIDQIINICCDHYDCDKCPLETNINTTKLYCVKNILYYVTNKEEFKLIKNVKIEIPNKYVKEKKDES